MFMRARSPIAFSRLSTQSLGGETVTISALSAAARTDRGRRRAENQDRILAEVDADGTTGLFAVADGMGGQRGGEIASALAVETLQDELLPLLSAIASNGPVATDKPLTARLHEVIDRCNARVLRYAAEHPETQGLGSTLALALVKGSLAVIGNIGDSRIYRIRDGAIETLTHDHSYVAQLVALGKIEPDEIYTHPQRNYIYRALGSEAEAQPDIFTQRLRSGDILLLCSDGLWGMVRDDALLRAVQDAETPDEAATRLVELANEHGGEDNISVVAVHAL